MFLPPKTVNVVFCRPSSSQSELYKREVSALLPSVLSDPGQHLAAISRLRKLCNGLSLLQDVRGRAVSWEEQAGKLATLTCLLLGLVADDAGEKIVLVSLHTSTLDLLSSLCNRHSVSWLRLDGSTQPSIRQGLVDRSHLCLLPVKCCSGSTVTLKQGCSFSAPKLVALDSTLLELADWYQDLCYTWLIMKTTGVVRLGLEPCNRPAGHG